MVYATQKITGTTLLGVILKTIFNSNPYLQANRYMSPQPDQPSGILGSHIVDIICCGNEDFLTSCSKIEQKLETKEKLFNSFKLFGISVRKTDYEYFSNHKKYLSILQEQTKEAIFDKIELWDTKLPGYQYRDRIFAQRQVWCSKLQSPFSSTNISLESQKLFKNYSNHSKQASVVYDTILVTQPPSAWLPEVMDHLQTAQIFLSSVQMLRS